MKLTLYNTLAGKKEEFKPLLPPEVRMYTCGPTVYNHAHIGNLRAYLFADTLRRVLEWNGFRVKQITNITDVGHLTSDADEGDDKMVRALKRLGKPLTLKAMREVADIYAQAFVADSDALNIERPERMPRASDHIPEDIELVKVLLKKGAAYRTASGIYFDISAFPDYGRLGRVNLTGLLAGSRVALNPDKRSPLDFALWKFSDGPVGWESDLGRGFPGWHVECSAMSRKYLGQPFDIHTGGIDHIPTHHQNEIAQSEAAYGAPLARFWLHCEHLILPSGPASAPGPGGVTKMAKSGENSITLKTLVDKGIRPLAYRYFVLTAHYRSPIQFSFKALAGAQESYTKLLHAFGRFSGDGSVHETYRKRCEESLNDDLHTPGAIAALWNLMKDKAVTDADKRTTILHLDRALGLDIEHQVALLKAEMESVPDAMQRLAERREEARRAGNFKEADSLRAEIHAAGFEVMDTDSGPIIRKRL